MIFIHGSLAMGGVETFIVRMAKQRYKQDKQTVIILLSTEDKSDKGLVEEARKYAKLLFLPDVVFLPSFASKIYPFHLVLLLKIKNEISQYFEDTRHVHATSGICILFYSKIIKLLPRNHSFTVGVYHSTEFTWGGKELPFFERANRDFFYNRLNRDNIIFFNESMKPLHEGYIGKSFDGVNLFPLGVVDDEFSRNPTLPVAKDNILRLVSVGRLVNFKTYNLHMLDVVSKLIDLGVSVKYDIYGIGPLEQEMEKSIANLNLGGIVSLKGLLDYNSFSETISSYDIFIGSGTAIIQASSLGVASIVGIECVDAPVTYGFFSHIQGFSYNEDNLYDKMPIVDVINEYANASVASKIELSELHKQKANEFTMETCVNNFEVVCPTAVDMSRFGAEKEFMLYMRYSLSFLWTSFVAKLNKSSLSEKIRDSDAPKV